VRTARRRPWLAALLSLLAPGVGQLYNGSARGGWYLFALFVGLEVIGDAVLPRAALKAAFVAMLAVALSELVLRLGAAIQAFRRARRIGGMQMGRYQHGWVYALLVLLLPVANAAAAPALQVRSFYAPSAAMVPTLLVGDYFIVDTQYYRRQAMQRGEIAVFKLPSDPSTDYIKRIVGLPGDRVQLRHGELYLNDEQVPRRAIDEYVYEEAGAAAVRFHQYIEALPRGPGEPPLEHRIVKMGDDGMLDNTPVYDVPPEHFFALGDSRDNSQDSRVFPAVGYIPARNLVGHVEFLWLSTDGSARWWQVWRWPLAVRYHRVLLGLS
jgi:signal peptidase I